MAFLLSVSASDVTERWKLPRKGKKKLSTKSDPEWHIILRTSWTAPVPINGSSIWVVIIRQPSPPCVGWEQSRGPGNGFHVRPTGQHHLKWNRSFYLVKVNSGSLTLSASWHFWELSSQKYVVGRCRGGGAYHRWSSHRHQRQRKVLRISSVTWVLCAAGADIWAGFGGQP